MTRITGTETVKDMLIKMCDGNPGGLNVMMAILEEQKRIDPDTAMPGVMGVLMLDTYEIYGSRIWIFFKDCCDSRIEGVLACQRVVQLGLKDISWLNSHVGEHYGKPIDVDSIIKLVQEKLPNFNKQQKVA
jgi:hypothetical protein